MKGVFYLLIVRCKSSLIPRAWLLAIKVAGSRMQLVLCWDVLRQLQATTPSSGAGFAAELRYAGSLAYPERGRTIHLRSHATPHPFLTLPPPYGELAQHPCAWRPHRRLNSLF